MTPASGRAHKPSSRTFVRSTQQRAQAATRRRAQQVSDGDQQRERHASIKAEKGHGNDLKVLQREDDHRAGEQNDDGEVDPTHGWLLIVDQETAGRGHSACYTSERSRRSPKPSPIQPTPAMMRSMPRNRPRI